MIDRTKTLTPHTAPGSWGQREYVEAIDNGLRFAAHGFRGQRDGLYDFHYFDPINKVTWTLRVSTWDGLYEALPPIPADSLNWIDTARRRVS
jgi:hypothetical protein